MRIENEIKLDFNDVLIRPKRSLAPSRKAIRLDRTFEFAQTKFKLEGVPIIASNMDTIGTPAMAQSLAKHNMLTCLDKHVSPKQFPFDARNHTFLTVGIKDKDSLRLKYMMGNYRLNLVCVDVANGYTQYFVDYIKKIRDMYPQLIIMAGNVATPEIVHELIAVAGADICKIGIGPGCFVGDTKVQTSTGVKHIKNIKTGDKVLTHKKHFQTVTATTKRKNSDDIISINGNINCTKKHQFYVIHKEDAEKITDENIHMYAKWVEAEKLNEDYYLIQVHQEV